jgi:serine/threonine-protein kinase
LVAVGDTLGRHRIVSRLSEGGMAALYLGRSIDAPDEPLSAIKVIHPSLSEDWQFLRMFVDEALISVRLRHPNVVRVDELGEENGVYYLVMEYVHGCSLAQLLRSMAQQGRRMRPDIALWIAREVAAGLHAAHEMTGPDGALLGVIHRDVSPQNVLLASDGEVKLLDFGIAKARGRADRTETGVIKGKVRYMAPEQAMGRDIDRRIDVYALGVVLWEMLTMRRYIEARNDVEVLRKVQSPDLVPPSFRAEGISSRIDEVVLRALALAPDARPATAAAFAEQLEGALDASDVGPAQVADLLRLFATAELRTASERIELAGGSARSGEVTRELTATDVDTLTARVVVAPPPEDDVLPAMAEVDGDVAPAVEEPPAAAATTAPAIESEPSVVVDDASPAEPSNAPVDEVDDEPTTVDPASAEVAALVRRARAAGPAQFTRPPARPPAPPPRRSLGLVVVAVIAFAVGLTLALVSMRWPFD